MSTLYLNRTGFESMALRAYLIQAVFRALLTVLSPSQEMLDIIETAEVANASGDLKTAGSSEICDVKSAGKRCTGVDSEWASVCS